MISFTKNELINAVSNSKSLSEAHRRLGLSNSYSTVKRYVNLWKIDTSHFQSNVEKTKAAINFIRKWTVDNAFVDFTQNKSNRVNGSILRRLILKNKLLTYKCVKCGNDGKWMGSDLGLDLDHIDGNRWNNRLDNLRFLCPNCHRTTETWGFKSNKTFDPNWRSKPRPNSRKVNRPSKEELQNLLKDNTWVSLGKRFNVSDNAVRKWAKSYNLL